MPVHLDLHIPRHAFSVRERARAGDVWRAFQEAAVLGSSAVGWPPQRYRAEACAFVVRRMVVVHHAEAEYGEPVHARTWVRDFRRGLLTTREIRLHGRADRTLAASSQEWVHVSFAVREGQVVLKPARAQQDLLDAFPDEDHDPAPTLPEGARGVRLPDAVHVLDIPLRLTEMDPLGHVNHPAYIDLVDEHTSRLLVAAGIDAVALQPLAEEVRFKAGLSAPGPARIETAQVGAARFAPSPTGWATVPGTLTGPGHAPTDAGGVLAVILAHRIARPDGTTAAEATTVRTLAGADPATLLPALEAP